MRSADLVRSVDWVATFAQDARVIVSRYGVIEDPNEAFYLCFKGKDDARKTEKCASAVVVAKLPGQPHDPWANFVQLFECWRARQRWFGQGSVAVLRQPSFSSKHCAAKFKKVPKPFGFVGDSTKAMDYDADRKLLRHFLLREVGVDFDEVLRCSSSSRAMASTHSCRAGAVAAAARVSGVKEDKLAQDLIFGYSPKHLGTRESTYLARDTYLRCVRASRATWTTAASVGAAVAYKKRPSPPVSAASPGRAGPVEKVGKTGN